MSVVTPKADIDQPLTHVGFGPFRRFCNVGSMSGYGVISEMLEGVVR